MSQLLLYTTTLGVLFLQKLPTVSIEMALEEKYFDYSFLMAVLCSGDVFLRFLVIRGTTQNLRSTERIVQLGSDGASRPYNDRHGKIRWHMISHQTRGESHARASLHSTVNIL